jgi:hypothetical protein
MPARNDSQKQQGSEEFSVITSEESNKEESGAKTPRNAKKNSKTS